MAGLIDDLIGILQEQCENYSDLLALSGEKRQVIIDNDAESLQKINQLENTLVGRNARLEKKRMQVVEDIVLVLNMKKGDITMTDIVQMIKNQPEHAPLLEVTEKLRVVISELKQINDTNRILINSSLEYIDFCMNVIRNTAQPDFTSYPGAKKIEKQGLFDAKQ